MCHEIAVSRNIHDLPAVGSPNPELLTSTRRRFERGQFLPLRRGDPFGFHLNEQYLLLIESGEIDRTFAASTANDGIAIALQAGPCQAFQPDTANIVEVHG